MAQSTRWSLFAICLLAALVPLASAYHNKVDKIFKNDKTGPNKYPAKDPFPNKPEHKTTPAPYERDVLKCPTTGPSPNYNGIHSNNDIHLWYYAQAPDVVSQTNIELYNNVKVSGVVWGGTGTDVQHQASVGGDKIVYAADILDVMFEDEKHEYLQVCAVTPGVPVACDSNSVAACRRCTNRGLTFDTNAVDLEIFPKGPNVLSVQKEYKDVDVYMNAELVLETPGQYKFANLHFWPDTKLVLKGEGTYEIAVDSNIDIDERFRVVMGRNTFLTFYQQADDGHVFISNAPADRDHVLPFNIISANTQNYVHLGHRQTLKGFISSAAQVYILSFAKVLGGECAPGA